MKWLRYPSRPMPTSVSPSDSAAATPSVLLVHGIWNARAWLLPVWEQWAQLGDQARGRLVRALEAGLSQIDGAWLARIESAHQAQPRDALLQYLAGMAVNSYEQSQLYSDLKANGGWKEGLFRGAFLVDPFARFLD